MVIFVLASSSLASGSIFTLKAKISLFSGSRVASASITSLLDTLPISAFLIFIPLVFYEVNYQLWQLLLLTLFVIGVLYLSVKLLNIKNFERKRIRKLISTQTFLRYSLVPIMLIPVIDLFYAFILIIFPFIWYILFAPLVGEKLFQPEI